MSVEEHATTEHRFTAKPSTKGYQRGCRCDECVRIIREYQRDYYRRNAEKERAKVRRYNERHPERRRETSRKFEQTHKEKRREKNRKWREANPERIAQHRREWKESGRKRANRAQYVSTEKGRRVVYKGWLDYQARKMNAPGTTTLAQLEARWAFYGHRCYLCGAPATTTDHVIPLNRGGTHWPSNLRPACKSCNSRKSDKPLKEFLSTPLT